MISEMLREFYETQEKAFPYRVELTDAGGPLFSGGAPMSYNDYNGTISSGRIQTPLSQRNASIHMQTYGGSEAIDWLMDAINYIVTAAGSASYHFEDNEKPVAAPPALQMLIETPNPHMSWTDLCELTLIDYLLVGNAYWVKWRQNADNQPIALYRMPPQFVRIVPGPFGPIEYRYRLPGDQNETIFTPNQVLQFRRPNPNDAYYGMGLVQGGARALDMEIALTNTAAHYYENQALPSGVVQTERRVPRDVFNKLKTQLRAFYGGSRNAGQLMVLEAGLKWTTVSPNAANALFAEMGTWSRDRIFAMFNINKGLMGIWDGTADPKLGDWQLLFDRKTMIPLMQKFSAAITRGLTKPGWGLDFDIDYEETQQPDQILKRAQTVAAIPGIKVHEVRDAAGYGPLGDPNLDNLVLNLPQPNLGPTGQGGAPDRNLLGEAGRPPLAEHTSAIGISPPAAAVTGRSGVIAGKAFKNVDEMIKHLDNLIEVKALAPANVTVGNQLGTPPADTLKSQRLASIDGAVSEAEHQLENAIHALERGLLDAVEGKAAGTAYQRIKNADAWGAFRDRLAFILETAIQNGLSLANVHHSKQGLKPGEIDYETVSRQLTYRKDGLGKILDTLKKTVLDRTLALQRAAGDPRAFENAIREELSGWLANKSHEIALNETSLGYNEGTFGVTEANGGDHVLVSDGEDYDEPCRTANGQIWALEQARANPLEHPNCRRAFVPVLENG